MRDVLLDVKDLEVVYETEDGVVKAVNGVSFQAFRGSTLGIVGETGAGKTTTAKSILRLLPERTARVKNGRVFFDGADMLRMGDDEIMGVRGKRISMIFQDPMSSLNPVLRVDEQIAEVLALHSGRRGLFGFPRRADADMERKVVAILEKVGIPADRKGEYPHQFSGGMKQRVVIAMALVCEPELVIADEPTTALDVTIQAQVLEMMEVLKREMGTSMVLITHDLGVVAQTCDDVAIMYAGEIVELGRVEDIFDPSIQHHPYTEGLFGSIPRLDDEANRLKPIKGLMPDPTDLSPGCKFAPRCPQRRAACEHPPSDVNLSATHRIRCLARGRESA
jgi:peptide/nickel transport system ATP-binding protein